MTTVTVQRTPQHAAQVTAVRPLTPRMRRLTLAGPSLVELSPRPAQDIELILTDGSGRRVKRRYTIRANGCGAGEFALDVLLHGHGPGSAWGTTAQVGDPVEFFGPRGKLELRDADWHLFVGDESALPAIAELVDALPPAQHALAVVEVGDDSDRLPIASRADVWWVTREGAAPGGSELLARGVDALVTPPGAGHAYLLGESRAMVALRPHVAAHGLDTTRVFVKGYWNLGRAKIGA
jgi:NADPH-dependent ferric siderophore reductase